MDPKIAVVIPTYNERENIGVLIEKISALKIPGIKIFVVDDNSPDGTGEVADKLAGQLPIRVIHRPKKLGLGKAYEDAFRQALKENPDFIIQMDADLSHNPLGIPILLEKIKVSDIVIGSRYIASGEIENWGLGRRLISRFGNLYARFALRLPYRDLTSGFKCYRAAALKKISADPFSSNGYNFQIETIFRASKLGLKISELPIIFTERKIGASKFNLTIIIESFLKVLALRYEK